MKKLSLTFGFLTLVFLLSIIGLIFVFESSVSESFREFSHPYHYVQLQFIRFLIGMALLAAMAFFPTKIFKKGATYFFLFSLGLMVLTLIPGLGVEINGAKRWLAFGPILFQPVEVLKLSLTTYFASWLSKHQRLGPFLLLTAVPVGLLLLQPDLGSALVILSIAFALYFLSGAKLHVIGSISAITLILVAFAILSSDYRRERLATFLNPELDPLGSSFHIRQITLALGSGSWLGQGIGRSRQKYSYIPEASTDSIFAIVAEELGFVGSSIILLLFAMFFHLGFRISRKQKRGSFNYLFASGIMVWIASQTSLNLAAVAALVPLTGLPLPFFSYGGTSLIMILLSCGILLKLARK